MKPIQLAMALLIALPAIALLALPARAVAAAPSATSAPGQTSQTPPCRHTGAEWQGQRYAAIGGTQCPNAKFTFTVGFDQAGGQVTVELNGCPSFLLIVPGHGKKVQKFSHTAIGPQPMDSIHQEYSANCGGLFSSPSCVPGQTSTALPKVNHWFEEACDFIPPQEHTSSATGTLGR